MHDDEIIKEILAGSKSNFSILVDRYQKMVFRVCIGFVHNKDDADDLTQEVFLRAFQSLSQFRGNSTFSTWLYRIAVNESLNKTRTSVFKILRNRLVSLTDQGSERDFLNILPENSNPEKLMIKQELSKRVNRALDMLPANQRTAIVLSKYDELSQKEIAEIMELSEGAVEALLQRAKKNLRKSLTGLKNF
jgi:RNA polymerase sigma-70 factor (ECF subfamily)